MVGMDGPPKKTRWESPPVQDALTAVVDSLGVRGRLFCRLELSAPWGMALPRNQLARFHVIERENARVRHGAGGPQTVLICGEFGFERREGHPLISALPPVIHLRGAPGSARALLDSGLDCSRPRRGAPERGTQALVSRSRFTARFAALVGAAPMAYLTRWRMQLAAGRLQSSGPRSWQKASRSSQPEARRGDEGHGDAEAGSGIHDPPPRGGSCGRHRAAQHVRGRAQPLRDKYCRMASGETSGTLFRPAAGNAAATPAGPAP
jgi:Cupin